MSSRISRGTIGLSFLGTLFLSAPLIGQEVPEQRLTRPVATYPFEFSSIRGFLELGNGKVLLSDGIDETLLRLSMAGGKADTIGRAGRGPGEYKGPDLLLPMPDGGVLLMDLGNGRLTSYDGNLGYLESKSIARGSPARGLMMVIARATDGQGSVYFEHAAFGPGSGGRPDSAMVIRYDPKAESFDTVAAVKREKVKISTSGGSQNRNVSMRIIPLSPRDGWAVAADGRIAIARASDYRLEWVGNDGRTTLGPPNRWRPVRVREAEKQEWIGEASNGLSIDVSDNNGQMSITMRRGGMRMGGRRGPRTDDREWPDSKPPFVARGVWVSPAGEAWVERSVAAGSSQVFDVFGADATLARRVILPEGRRLIGFGKGAIYARRATEDDLQILERFRLQ